MNEAVGLLLVIGVNVLFGALVGWVAQSRGRSFAGWFLIGLFAGPCIGLILVLVLPDVNEQRAREQRLARENRRLRERLGKDRQVADVRHASVERRLAAHDTALQIDTSDPDPELLTTDAGGDAGDADAVRYWYYVEGGERQGPVGEAVMQGLWQERTIGERTLVWTQGMAEWQEIRDLPELEEQLHG